MPFVEDENGNHILDSDGNKITFSVSYGGAISPAYVRREPLHINDDGHINTENRHIVTKDGVNADHVVTKGQLDNTMTNINSLIKSNIQKAIIQLRNEQIRGRIGRKALTIPKTNYTWINLLDVSEIDGVTTLQDVIIPNVYIRHNDRYHHAKSDLVSSSFDQLEFFFKADFSTYYCSFNNHPSDWNMECFLEYIVIPKEISVEDSDEE